MTVIDVLPPVQTPLLSVSPLTAKSPPHMEANFDTSTTATHRLTETEYGGATDGALGRKQRAPAKQPVTRGRRKSRWKLKFHHQALPPEYLKHYKQQEKKRRLNENRLNKAKKTAKMSGEAAAADAEFPTLDSLLNTTSTQEDPTPETDEFNFWEGENPHLGIESDGVKKDAKRLQQNVREAAWPTPGLLGDGFPNLNIDLSQNKAFLENLLSNQIEINRVDRQEKVIAPIKPSKPPKTKAIPSSGRIMNYSDLPYMGEITLDGIKPRRGRKPKKADICHLIYKNYGQIFPGAPNSFAEKPPAKAPKFKAPHGNSSATSIRPQVESPLPTVSGLINHTEVQNRIINSLLEKRLTQEARGKTQALTKADNNIEEPLNLCLRDLKSLKIKLSRKHGNVYEAKSPELPPKIQDSVEIKKEIIDLESEDDEDCTDDVDLTPFNLVTTELRESSDDESCVNLGNQVTLTKVTDKTPLPSPNDPTTYWPGSNYFCPSMPLFPELYYQKLNSAKPPVAALEKKPLKSIKPKQKRMPTRTDTNAAQVIAKRKRSAIFIPPVPPENTSNPTTEVSICKFKFTGGAKPSLQEKKMLSVDAGGNFRYYSGTGDKSMRGYEYFPRESLQQCQENTGCSPSGVFLTASALGSGEKISEEVGQSNFFDASFNVQMPTPAIPPVATPSVKKNKARKMEDVLPMLREHMTDNLEDDDSEDGSLGTAPSPAGSEFLRDDNSHGEEGHGKRPRRSRKSLAREKLEQTFKEKGFLIQTQQLESAEGATYCKFRQLRKFTRYLFRSWKDYLPGNVRDLSLDAGVGPLETPPEPLSPSSVSTLSPPIKIEPHTPMMDS